jgi:hypothetical protein
MGVCESYFIIFYLYKFCGGDLWLAVILKKLPLSVFQVKIINSSPRHWSIVWLKTLTVAHLGFSSQTCKKYMSQKLSSD